MLSEKKITAEEAEKLLSAISKEEGNGTETQGTGIQTETTLYRQSSLSRGTSG